MQVFFSLAIIFEHVDVFFSFTWTLFCLHKSTLALRIVSTLSRDTSTDFSFCSELVALVPVTWQFNFAEIGGAVKTNVSVFSVLPDVILVKSWLTLLFKTVFLLASTGSDSSECKNSGGSFHPRSRFPVERTNNYTLRKPFQFLNLKYSELISNK